MSIRIIRSDRRTGGRLAVKGPQLLMQVGEHARHEDIHAPQQVLLRNHLVEVELIE
jgi:hypothetical protein